MERYLQDRERPLPGLCHPVCASGGETVSVNDIFQAGMIGKVQFLLQP